MVGEFTVTTSLSVEVQPDEEVTVTLYVPPWLTVMLCVCALFDQAYDVKPLPAFNVTVPPWQKVVGPLAVI